MMSRPKPLPPALEVAHAARSTLAGLCPGDTVLIMLPNNRFSWRHAREAIAAECYRMFGAGGYSVTTRGQGGVARVTRKHKEA